jgi:hypothetical protein
MPFCIHVSWTDPDPDWLIHGPYETDDEARAAWEGASDADPVWFAYAQGDEGDRWLPDDVEHEVREMYA